MISGIVSNDVMFQLADPARAGLILPTEDAENEELLMLLMPMLLNE
jgi:DNA polymerase-3 subunit beta